MVIWEWIAICIRTALSLWWSLKETLFIGRLRAGRVGQWLGASPSPLC